MSDSGSGNSDLDNSGVKAVITLGVLVVAGAVSLVIAKICQLCRKKRLLPNDDESDISDNTKNIIRSRLSVIRFKKDEIKRANKNRTVGALRKWIDIVKKRKKEKEEGIGYQNGARNVNDKVLVTGTKNGIDKLKENGAIECEKDTGVKVKENGTPRVIRFPSFTSSKNAGGGSKPQDGTRTSDTVPVTVEQTSPVQRGRPVSSKARALPNVTVATIETVPKVQVKSVSFEEDSKPKMNGSISNKSLTTKTNPSLTLGVENLAKSVTPVKQNSVTPVGNSVTPFGNSVSPVKTSVTIVPTVSKTDMTNFSHNNNIPIVTLEQNGNAKT